MKHAMHAKSGMMKSMKLQGIGAKSSKMEAPRSYPTPKAAPVMRAPAKKIVAKGGMWGKVRDIQGRGKPMGKMR